MQAWRPGTGIDSILHQKMEISDSLPLAGSKEPKGTLLPMVCPKALCCAASLLVLCIPGFLPLHASDNQAMHGGYYLDPAVHGDTLIFTSEGDLWSVNV